MKLTKKKVLLIALLVCALAILSLGTVAWFNASDSVTNKFMIADSDTDGTPDFSVDVWETENDGDDNADADGDGSNTTAQNGNSYDKIAPGDVLAKDPTVENTGDYSQWIRVLVTFDEYSEIKKAYDDHGKDFDLRTWFTYSDIAKWVVVDTPEIQDNAITYTYYLNAALEPDQKETLFTSVTIPTWFEQEDMQYVNGNFTISVVAQAIQSDNTEATAKDSFEQYWIY